MEKILKAIQISEHVYWVGAIDWGIRDFHGYATSRGSTYNAFLVRGEKTVLIDVVKRPFKEELLSRIRSILPPDQIDYIISNHSEPDHSGCLDEIIDIVKPEKVFASPVGVRTLQKHFHWAQEVIPVKTGEKLDLGNLTLSFMETRMLHWPDSMFTYLEEDKVLFSQDAFGMHLATGERFIDECPPEVVHEEAEKYFANILLLYAPRVSDLILGVAESGLEFEFIAPDHGPIWRKDLDTPIRWYTEWAAQKPQLKAVIVYDTMWQATENMALTISEALIEEGINVRVMPLKGSHRTDIVRELLTAGAILVGSPTLNNNIFPSVADVMTYVKGLKPVNMIGAAFGSYGWSGEAVKQVVEYLTAFEVKVVDTLKVQYQPSTVDLEKCTELGRNMAAQLKAHVAEF